MKIKTLKDHTESDIKTTLDFIKEIVQTANEVLSTYKKIERMKSPQVQLLANYARVNITQKYI